MAKEKIIRIYKNYNYLVVIETNIHIPFEESVEELAHILIQKYNLHIYNVQDLIDHLTEFITINEDEYYNDYIDHLIDNKKEDVHMLETTTKEWEKLMKQELAEFGEKRCASDEELFATAYHKMVHSPALETMLKLEHSYAKSVRQRTEEKNNNIQRLSDRQSEEMNKAVDNLEFGMTESRINELVAKHYETHSLLKVKYASELDTIKESQRRQYRDWLMEMLEQNQAKSSLPTLNSPLSSIPPTQLGYSEERLGITESPGLEESFTIHLGSQLKQMHNIRILSGNVIDLCSVEDSSSTEPRPQQLQTALALYSNDLSGLVLMTDNKIGSRLTKDFQETCLKSTEFHFSHIDNQLDTISNTAHQFLKDPIRNSSRNVDTELLQSGDFYMTRHSNLAQVHVMFHVVADDSLRGNEITSRHSVVLGLRNILKTACSNDITSLTIPLLLQYELTEEMTTSWCEKRAELVYKCVKGFMIEMASWGGSDLKNMQFMLPLGISTQVFHTLADMLPRIFKLSNPKILK